MSENIKTLLRRAKSALAQCEHVAIPLSEAQRLLCHVLRCDKTMLYTQSDALVSLRDQKNFAALIQRRESGEPIAYIIGHTPFWTFDLKVTADTLIPRPETECLVERVLEKMGDRENLSVIDLGTGTGAIAIALAKEKKSWRIIASDASDAALAVARDNIETLQVDHVATLKSNWFERVDTDKKFDVIVSNPPYIAENDPHLSRGDLRFEPRAALASGASGLDAITTIIAQAPQHLSPGGLLLFEHGYQDAEPIRHLLSQASFSGITTHKDLSGHDRVTGGVWS